MQIIETSLDLSKFPKNLQEIIYLEAQKSGQMLCEESYKEKNFDHLEIQLILSFDVIRADRDVGLFETAPEDLCLWVKKDGVNVNRKNIDSLFFIEMSEDEIHDLFENDIVEGFKYI